MAYMKMENLYRPSAQGVLMFKEVYAMEKIHGTSAHVKWDVDGTPQLWFFSGGEKAERFTELFDATALKAAFMLMGHDKVTVYGEAYGGKQQGMRETYGELLKFVAFEVQVGDTWLSVPNADSVAEKLGIEFVFYTRGPATLEWLDGQRDRPSQQAMRNGIEGEKAGEGIVIRPLFEFRDHRGNRLIAKHKTAKFCERATPQAVDPAKRELMMKANEIAEEWVTDMRLNHVLQKIEEPHDLKKTGEVIKAMIADVNIEAADEIAGSKAVNKAIGTRCAQLYKAKATRVVMA